MRKKYQTEEERKQARREYDKQRYQANREKVLEQRKQYYQDNKEKILEQQKEYKKQYYETNKEKIAEYYQENKEKRTECMRQWYEVNREKVLEQRKQYYQTPIGRASMLVNGHNREDKKYNRGECSLTALWIRNYIFPQKCVYCGEDDWRKLGCDRKDNSLPHSPSNVVPCCVVCNKKRQKKPFEEFVAECNAQERLKEWEAFLAECE